jgi:hypothetical protein
LKTCYDLITKHGAALQRALAELESGEDLANKNKIVNERATLFRISSNAMINACTDYLSTSQTQGHKWSKMLQHERDQRLHLEEMVEQLARQHSHLEAAAASRSSRHSELFFNCFYIKYHSNCVICGWALCINIEYSI